MKMSEEIKELLSIVSEGQNSIQLQKIENYITNLQEELKEANENLTWWTNRFNAVERDNRGLKQENQKLVKELDTLRGRIITFINVFQDEKTFGLSYSNLKHLRGIVNNNKFDVKVLDDKLTELKGGSDDVKN